MEHQTGWQGRVKIKVTRHSVRGSGQDDREGGHPGSSRAQNELQKAIAGNSGVRGDGPVRECLVFLPFGLGRVNQ